MVYMPIFIRPTLTAILIACSLGVCSLSATSANSDLTTTTEANSTMPTFSINYIVENDYVKAGEAVFKLSKAANRYQLVLETKPTGMFRFTKKGKIREIAELPSLNPPFLSEKYSYTNFGDQNRSFTSVYDRQTGEATVVRGGNPTTIPIDAGAVDRLSMTLAIMHQLHDTPEIKNFAINSVDNNGMQTFSFVSRGQTQLKTDIGTLTTTRIDRQRSNSNRNTITWFAALEPGTIPVPVQIEQYKRGKLTARLKITRHTSE